MKKPGLRKQIIKYLKDHGGWVHKGDVEDFGRSVGYLAETATRRCRELESEGILEKREERNSVLYKFKKVENIIGTPRIYLEGRKEELSGQIKIF